MQVIAPRKSASRLHGLGIVAVGTGVAMLASAAVPTLSMLVVAVVVGIVVGNAHPSADRARPGFQFAAKQLLRWGVVLLGLRLSVGDVVGLGAAPLVVVALTVGATFFGTQWLGARLGLSRDLSLLIGTGYAICGASAIAAVEGSTDATEDETAAALGLVALAGTAAVFALPLLGGWIGLDDPAFGAWAGASIHDVGQVVAASSVSDVALSTAVVVKLSRVVLLAPLVAGVNIARRNDAPSDERPPLLPAFVVGFLAMIALRSTELLPTAAIDGAKTVEGLLLAAGMVGLGSAVRIARLRRLGPTPLVVGALAWLLVGGVSLLGVVVTS